ncbi:MAG: hypothetical protein EZS28_023049, partial [Streblomastix strix]
QLVHIGMAVITINILLFLLEDLYLMGNVYYKANSTYGNTGFRNNEIVRLEYNSKKGTVTYFLNNVQQPVYISGIREKIRFVIEMCYSGSTCTIRSLKKLKYPTAVTKIGDKSAQW